MNWNIISFAVNMFTKNKIPGFSWQIDISELYGNGYCCVLALCFQNIAVLSINIFSFCKKWKRCLQPNITCHQLFCFLTLQKLSIISEKTERNSNSSMVLYIITCINEETYKTKFRYQHIISTSLLATI